MLYRMFMYDGSGQVYRDCTECSHTMAQARFTGVVQNVHVQWLGLSLQGLYIMFMYDDSSQVYRCCTESSLSMA